MNTKAAAAAVTGARHVRAGRNGQDAAASWVGDGCGAIVVCDGCGSGAYSELGSRLGARLVMASLAEQLAAGTPATDVWSGMRAYVLAELKRLVVAMRGEPATIVREHFLFTIVAGAWRGPDVCVWAAGDGAYAIGDRVVVLGPFADNQPPYLGYELLGEPIQPHVGSADATAGRLAVATDGVAELVGPCNFTALSSSPRLVGHPDALRRQLALLARSPERIDWDARRIERSPAALQDDGAVALLRWEVA